MSRFIITSRAFALLACSVLLVASIGCSPGTPTDPSSAPQNVVVSPDFVRILSTSDKSLHKLTLSSDETSGVISAESGGVITNGRVTLDFPPFALSEDTEITIEMLNDGTLGANLGPHGIQFNKPVTITMDLTGTTAEASSQSVDVFWWNSAERWYEKMQKVDSDSIDRLSAQLHHFSNYKAGVGG